MSDITPSLNRILDKFKTAFSVTSVIPGSKLHQLAESIAYEVSIVEDDVQAYANINSLLNSTGSILDDIGNNIYGIARLSATRPVVSASMKAIKFYTNNKVLFGDINKINGLQSDIIIPEGTLISGSANNNTYTFRVSKETTLPRTSFECYISAELVNGDYKLIPSNSLNTHTFTEYSQNAGRTLLVGNPVAIGTGSENESDENYRYRLMTSLQASQSSGYYGIKNNLITMPGISNVEILPGAFGGGTFAVYVQGITPVTSDGLIEQVKYFLSDIAPPWSEYKVFKPNYYGITATISINAGTTSLDQSVLDKIAETVKAYINNFYGTEFHPKQLQQIVSYANSSIYNVSLTSLQLYSGNGDFRLYEEIDLLTLDPVIYISAIDKIIVEPDIDTPITVMQVV